MIFILKLPATPSPQECSNVYPVKAFFESIILKKIDRIMKI